MNTYYNNQADKLQVCRVYYAEYKGRTIHDLKILISASQVFCKITLLLHSRHSDRPGPVSHIIEGEEPLDSDFVLKLDINFAVLTLTPLPHLDYEFQWR